MTPGLSKSGPARGDVGGEVLAFVRGEDGGARIEFVRHEEKK